MGIGRASIAIFLSQTASCAFCHSEWTWLNLNHMEASIKGILLQRQIRNILQHIHFKLNSTQCCPIYWDMKQKIPIATACSKEKHSRWNVVIENLLTFQEPKLVPEALNSLYSMDMNIFFPLLTDHFSQYEAFYLLLILM